MSDEIRECRDEPCRFFWPGHNLHPTNASAAAGTPEQWRDGVVTALDGRTITVTYVNGDGSVAVWHHADPRLRVGDPLTVHEKYHVVQVGRRLLNVGVISGAGDVPDGAITDRDLGERFAVSLDDGEGFPVP